LIGSKVVMPAIVLAALVFAAVPLAIALNGSGDENGTTDTNDNGLVSVKGKVTAFLYGDDHDDEQNETNESCDHDWDHDANETHDGNYTHHDGNCTRDDDNETDYDHDDNETDYDHDDNETDYDHENKTNHTERVCAFVIDNETIVEFGPWWYWLMQNVTVTDVVHVGDMVNVTGEWENDTEDGMNVLEAWKIVNDTTGDVITIKEEGRPPWAGSPKALGFDPWPPSDEDE